MMFIDEMLRIFEPSRKALGFVLIRKKLEKDAMGSGLADFESNKLFVRLLSDRGQPDIEIASKRTVPNWLGLSSKTTAENAQWDDISLLMEVSDASYNSPDVEINAKIMFLLENFKELETKYSKNLHALRAELDAKIERRFQGL